MKKQKSKFKIKKSKVKVRYQKFLLLSFAPGDA
jgi:hypothetical protein